MLQKDCKRHKFTRVTLSSVTSVRPAVITYNTHKQCLRCGYKLPDVLTTATFGRRLPILSKFAKRTT